MNVVCIDCRGCILAMAPFLGVIHNRNSEVPIYSMRLYMGQRVSSNNVSSVLAFAVDSIRWAVPHYDTPFRFARYFCDQLCDRRQLYDNGKLGAKVFVPNVASPPGDGPNIAFENRTAV